MPYSACAAAIVKSGFIANYGKSGDFLWDSTNLTIWVAYVPSPSTSFPLPSRFPHRGELHPV